MKRILVVEDDRDLALALTVRLRAAGFEPSVAYDTTSVVPMATRSKPDLILLDISMPGGGGLVAARRLRTLTPLATIPFIVLTASKKPELKEEAMALGATAFFEKPYESAELLVAISSAIGEAADPTSVARAAPGPAHTTTQP